MRVQPWRYIAFLFTNLKVYRCSDIDVLGVNYHCRDTMNMIRLRKTLGCTMEVLLMGEMGEKAH